MGEKLEAVVGIREARALAGVAGDGQRVGTATASVHHGEILQGVFEGADGELRRGLLSMPCDLYTTRATYLPGAAPSVAVWPPSKVKARRAAEQALAALDRPGTGGHLYLSGDVPPSRGFGSSTSDVVAAVWAVQCAFDRELPRDRIAQLAVRAETASDPLMFGANQVLFAHRDGVVLEDFGARLPRLVALGFGTSDTGAGVDTLAMPPAEYRPWEVRRFRELRDALRAALAAGDCGLLGAVATASAEINQRHLPVPCFDLIRDLVRRTGAVGLQVAHSGDIASLLFDAGQPDAVERRERARALLAGIGIGDVWTFAVGGR
jgi:uncharacterized protein involved in propanediol utilization